MKNMTDIYGMFINGYGSGVDLELFVTHCIISFTGILLNFVVIALVMCSRRLQEVEGVAFVFNLSCANFIFSAQILFIGFSTKDGIALPKQVCNAFAATTTFSCVAASLSRCVVALDRYVYISDPLHYYIRSTESKIALLITCLWIAAGCLSLTPYITNLFLNRDSTDENCLPSPSSLYIICVLVLGVLLPMVYEVFVYTRIFFWAILHIQIMKQEALYGTHLRRSTGGDSYNGDVYQLQLLSRASFLLLNSDSSCGNKNNFGVSNQSTQENVAEVSSNAGGYNLTSTLKRLTMSSNKDYFGSLLKRSSAENTFSKQTSFEKKDSCLRNSDLSLSTGVDTKQDIQALNRSQLLSSQTREMLKPEVKYSGSEVDRLSDAFQASEPSLLFRALSNLRSSIEVKAGYMLLLILGSSIGFWVPYMVLIGMKIVHLNHEPWVFEQQAANILVYALCTIDPIVYDFMHQPIRSAIQYQIRHSLGSLKSAMS